MENQFKQLIEEINQLDSLKAMEACTAFYSFNKDMKEVYDAWKTKRTRISQISALSFYVGDKVSFDSSGKDHEGVVVKVNIKNIVVKTEAFGSWNIPAGHLTKI